jgi:hypothetical protein
LRSSAAGPVCRILPLFENVDAIGKRQREIDALLGKQNRHALLLQRADR